MIFIQTEMLLNVLKFQSMMHIKSQMKMYFKILQQVGRDIKYIAKQ